MSDFFQNGIITTLHNLSTRSQEALEGELAVFAEECPMTLVLPRLYSRVGATGAGENSARTVWG